MAGPLAGLRVIELAGLGPAPFCGMMLADHGAEVIRVERLDGNVSSADPLARSRRSIRVNLKAPDGVEIVRKLAAAADGLIEGFRPGVMERLGLGPEALLPANPKLVYGRMTGWGQHGPYAAAAGHDIDYIAISGALHTCGRAGGQPTPPVNYLGDFGGGGMMLAFGMVSAMLAVKNGAPGQVIDCAMTDGSALLTAMTWGFYGMGQWHDKAGVNLLDTGAPYYDTYETADGKWIAVGAIEPQFYAALREQLGIADDPDFDGQYDASAWPRQKDKLRALFLTRTRRHWCALMQSVDACLAPVLSLAEAPLDPHNLARGTFIEVGGAIQPAPAPRYSKTPLATPRAAPVAGADTDDILGGIGIATERVAALRSTAAIA